MANSINWTFVYINRILSQILGCGLVHSRMCFLLMLMNTKKRIETQNWRQI